MAHECKKTPKNSQFQGVHIFFLDNKLSASHVKGSLHYRGTCRQQTLQLPGLSFQPVTSALFPFVP